MGLILLGTGMIIWAVSLKYLPVDDSVSASYTACGCGGCGGVEPAVVYVDNAAEYDQIVERDKALKSSQDCHASGCSLCTEYRLRKG